jgi:hypothetical protein
LQFRNLAREELDASLPGMKRLIFVTSAIVRFSSSTFKANIPNNLQLHGQVAEAEAFSPQSEQSRILTPTASELNCAADEVMRDNLTSVNT